MRRREFLHCLGLLGLSSLLASCSSSIPATLYPAEDFGNATLLHFTDCHAQLLPIYYREPDRDSSINGLHKQTPDMADLEFLRFVGIQPHSKEAYALTQLDFVKAARLFGKMGGFAELAALIKQIKTNSQHENIVLLDGGDSWQGSATALWTQGKDMVEACNLLGVDVMTGHWEFTYGSGQVNANLKAFRGEFVAQNISLTEEAQFAADSASDTVFKPYVIKEFGAIRLAVIGQAYPYTPIANPQQLIPDWQFGIQEQRLQKIINHVRQQENASAVVLLSHNGLPIDLKLASRVTGLDVILGGHTHDAMPKPVWINNPGGKTCVTNAGSHGKFLAVLDMDIGDRQVKNIRYRLLPVFADLLEPDAAMQALINRWRQPYEQQLRQSLKVADKLLYRRDTWKGTFDELLLDALITTQDAQIALSPGFRWGTSVLPGQTITYEDVMSHTAITYPNTQRRSLTGREIKAILEDAADNVFNSDPYYRQGGDMVRVGGMTFQCNLNAAFGQRIGGMRLNNGDVVVADKTYSVASWASVSGQASGSPMGAVLAEYLRRG
ncbi:MAG: thiosulfohydrolase SoxB [Gammaproteobacteria bacterium]|nr:thiosulfohydrolase SoxB [Gammaproteobacteria bacterium]